MKPGAPLGPVEHELARAVASHRSGDNQTAAALYRAVLARDPHCFDALHLLGILAAGQGAWEPAIALFRRALAQRPADLDATLNLSRALLQIGDGKGAVALLAPLAEIHPENADVQFLLANTLQSHGENDRCIASYKRGLRLEPGVAPGWNNLAAALRQVHRPAAALDCATRALALEPGYAKAHNNRGLALMDLRRIPDALESFDRALAAQPEFPEALHNRGTALVLQARHLESAAAFKRLCDIAPGFPHARGNLLHARLSCGDWRDYASDVSAVVASIEQGHEAALPYSFICVSDDPSAQKRCAELHSQRQYPTRHARTVWERPRKHGRIKIAYLSGDFGDHAVSYLLAGALEAHDRRRFETLGISWGRQSRSPMRVRMEAAFDHFIDVTTESDSAIAKKLRDLEVDIAVDLTGHTRGDRMAIFALRPAPVQVNFLGIPVTTGADFIDYLIADEFVIPVDRRQSYSEKIAWLPGTFQPNDDSRPLPRGRTRRDQFGLPTDGVVYCSFNVSAKLNPVCFEAWMRILGRVPGSVLWLLGSATIVEQNLRYEAARRGIEPRRLVFAGQLPYAEHLQRYEHADLFLDTLPFNAGATASDALSMGVPLLTCAGSSFAGRMAGSLLSHLGLPELICGSLAEYETTAVNLAADPCRLAQIRDRLLAARDSHPFFDTKRYCRHLEAAYLMMWKRVQDGLAPIDLRIEPDADQPMFRRRNVTT